MLKAPANVHRIDARLDPNDCLAHDGSCQDRCGRRTVAKLLMHFPSEIAHDHCTRIATAIWDLNDSSCNDSGVGKDLDRTVSAGGKDRSLCRPERQREKIG